MLFTSWLRSIAPASPRFSNRRRNVTHRRRCEQRRRSRWEGLATAGVEKLEPRVLLAAPTLAGPFSMSANENGYAGQQIGQISGSDPDAQTVTV